MDEKLTKTYQRDGYVFPLTAMSPDEATRYRAALEQVEADHPAQPKLLSSLHGQSHLVLPAVDEITRLPGVLNPVRQILGPDLLVWSANLFIKEARSPQYVSWHQDLTYWGLNDLQQVTAWVALSPATVENGCMRFITGSHQAEIVAHRDTFAENNLLTRGQEIAVEVDETRAVDVILKPGEISLHHGRTFHASHANRSQDRRVGLAIRYISPAMRQVSGQRTVASLVSGEDRYGHFDLVPPPAGVLDPADVARLKRAVEQQNAIYFDGAAQLGKRVNKLQ